MLPTQLIGTSCFFFATNVLLPQRDLAFYRLTWSLFVQLGVTIPNGEHINDQVDAT